MSRVNYDRTIQSRQDSTINSSLQFSRWQDHYDSTMNVLLRLNFLYEAAKKQVELSWLYDERFSTIWSKKASRAIMILRWMFLYDSTPLRLKNE